MATKEYEMAIKIAGMVEKSFTESTGLTKKELRAIASEAASASNQTKYSFSQGVADTKPIFEGLSKTAKTVFRGIVRSAEIAGAGIAAGLAGTVKTGMDFEQQMSVVQAYTQADAEAMAQLTEQAEQLGATTKFTAAEVGSAMEYMGLAGWSTEQISAGIAGVMDLAAASGEDIGAVSDIVTDAMSAFGLGADQVNRFSDVLAQASASSNTTVGMMGEAFQYVAPVMGAMGYNIEDVATAIGLMANNGIKASRAGTALRSMVTRMAAPTKQSGEAMDMLGLSLVDEEGRAKSLMDIMLDLRQSMNGMVQPTDEQLKALSQLEEQYESNQLTEEEFDAKQQSLLESIYGVEGAAKAAAASQLAGKTAMAGLLAIVNTSDDDFNSLYWSIMNSTGAAKEMANVKLDNLAGDVTILGSALDGLKIEAYSQMKDPLREVTQWFTGLVGGATEKVATSGTITDFIADLQEKIPGVIRNLNDFKDALSGWLSPLQTVGGWLIDNPEVISGFITGIGTAIITGQVISKVSSFVGYIGKLAGILTNPWAVAILAVSGAVSVLMGVFAAVKTKTAIDRAKDLADHFGSIQLSITDLQDAAQAIVDNGSLDSLNDTISAFESSNQAIKDMKSAVRTLNRANWKVSVGLKLTEEEQSEYSQQISNYVTACQTFVDEQAYAIHLSVDFLKTDGSEGEQSLASVAASNLETFLQTKQTELADLGADLNKAVTEAFNDGLLEIDEVEKIQQIQSQMAAIQAELASSGFEASLERIGMGYSGANLTAESFKNLQAEISTVTADAKAKYDAALESQLASVYSSYNAGAFGEVGSQEAKDQMDALANAFKQQYLDNLAEINLQTSAFTMNTIMDSAYGEEIMGAMESFAKNVSTTMALMLQDTDLLYGNGDTEQTLYSYMSGLAGDSDLTDDAKANLKSLLNELEPSVQVMQSLADQYKDLGIAVPENISEGLKNIALLRAMTGDIDSTYALMADEIAGSEQLQGVKDASTEEGNMIPKSIADAIKARQSDINTAVDDSYQTTADYIRQVYDSGFTIDTVIRVNTSTDVGSPNVPQYASGAILSSPELAWVAEGGYPESIIPWDGSQRSFDLWAKTGEGIGAFDLVDGVLDALNGEHESGGMVITYSPVLNFNGGTPSKDDIVEAGRISQQEFNQLMAGYERDRRRLSFGG